MVKSISIFSCLPARGVFWQHIHGCLIQSDFQWFQQWGTAQVPSTNSEAFSKANSLKFQNTRTNFKTSCYFSIDKTLGTRTFVTALLWGGLSAFVVTKEIADPEAPCSNSLFLSDRLDVDWNISVNFPSKNTKYSVPWKGQQMLI